MPTYPIVIYDAVSKTHRPVAPNESESVDPTGIPLAPFVGNKLLRHSDGLYYGTHTLPPVIQVDPDLGTDAEPSLGATTLLCRTLQFALDLIEAREPQRQEIQLKCGASYSVTRPVLLSKVELTISAFGDPKYGGAYDLLNSQTKLQAFMQADFTRPVIVFGAAIQDVNVTNNWWCNYLHLLDSRLRLVGVRITLPSAPNNLPLAHSAYSNLSCVLFSDGNSEVRLAGTIVDKVDPISYFGFLGVRSRTAGKLTLYGSQFLTSSRQITTTQGTTASELSNRLAFVKLLPDYPSLNTTDQHFSAVPTALGSTPGAARLDLFITLTPLLADLGTSSTNLETFPAVTPGFGIQNYIYGLTRDQQFRPLNVSCNYSI